MHEPVMLAESIRGLNLNPRSVVVDATLGGGGHAAAILARLGPDGVLIGIDRDPEAVERARVRLTGCGRAHLHLEQANFGRIAEVAARLGVAELDAVLMDLGVSSFQIDEPGRGFSFQAGGPLDMRMGPDADVSAMDIVNGYSEEVIAGILFRLGEERSSRRIAKAIVAEREASPIEDTARLAKIVADAKGGRRGRIHPATKSFMALRMAVNDELGNLDSGLKGGLNLLKVGGRMAVITFHSIEDRLVKRFFRRHAGRRVALQAGGDRWEGELPPVEILTGKPIVATRAETASNPRARSAKLRVAERRE